MLLELTHETIFEYSEPVFESYVELRITPVTDSSQHLLQHRQRVLPNRPVRQYVDAFGNTVSYFNIMPPHERIEVAYDSVVETQPTRHRGPVFTPEARGSAEARLPVHDYLQQTALTAWGEEFRAWVKPLEHLRGTPPEEAAETIREAIYSGFRYEGDVTSASSPLTDLLQQGAGVCQDFTHLMLATCRYLGFPARYVSGYVLTRYEAEEANASHAWCEVYDPEQGWFGVDPTHNEWVEERHVRLGIGRDYRDVPPNRGVLRGLAEETMHVRVRMRPISPDMLEYRARSLYTQGRAGAMSTLRTTRKPAPASSILQQTSLAQQQQQQ